MTTFILIAASLILSVFIAIKFTRKPKTEKSIDVADTLLPESDIHAEIAKMAEAIKAQSPVVIEAPFVAETTKSKKKPAAKKSAPTTKATPKKSK
jgi:hypothetical protein